MPSVVFAQAGQNSNSVVSQWTEMCVKHYNDNFIKGQPLMHDAKIYGEVEGRVLFKIYGEVKGGVLIEVVNIAIKSKCLLLPKCGQKITIAVYSVKELNGKIENIKHFVAPPVVQTGTGGDIWQGLNVIQKVQIEAIGEYVKANSGVVRNSLAAYAVKIAGGQPQTDDGVYIVDVAQIKKDDGTPIDDMKVKNLTTYNIQINTNIHKHIINRASIEDKLFSVEKKYMEYFNIITQNGNPGPLPPFPNTAAKDALETFNLRSNRLYFDVIRELKANGPDASANFDRLVTFIKSRKLPGVSAYIGLAKNLRDKLKYDLNVCQQLHKPKEVIELIKGYLDKTERLYKIIITGASGYK
jgi:hypothetical protein